MTEESASKWGGNDFLRIHVAGGREISAVHQTLSVCDQLFIGSLVMQYQQWLSYAAAGVCSLNNYGCGPK
eukprot:778559-Amphidinium_carterae.1